jgi:hypothetical protein
MQNKRNVIIFVFSSRSSRSGVEPKDRFLVKFMHHSHDKVREVPLAYLNEEVRPVVHGRNRLSVSILFPIRRAFEFHRS